LAQSRDHVPTYEYMKTADMRGRIVKDASRSKTGCEMDWCRRRMCGCKLVSGHAFAVLYLYDLDVRARDICFAMI
jgi:hypothetical protein